MGRRYSVCSRYVGIIRGYVCIGVMSSIGSMGVLGCGIVLVFLFVTGDM